MVVKGDHMDYLKAEQLSGHKWRVLALPFGGEFKDGKDADGEFFSARTDPFGPYKGLLRERPAVFHHGMDSLLEGEVVGIEDDLELEEKIGWWANLWLDRSNRYHAAVDALLRAGKMYGSSGAVPQFIKKDRQTGEILVWPHIEQTLTLTPANRLSVVKPTKTIDYFEAAGITLDPAAAALLSDPDDSPTADLRSDLPTGGDDAAIQRLAGQVARLEELIKQL